jgi:WD40 repeat protein
MLNGYPLPLCCLDPGGLFLRHSRQPDCLLVALSNGCTASYKLVLDTPDPKLHLVESAQLFPDTCLVLSLAPNTVSDDTLATLSTGETAVVNTENGTMETKHTWQAHDLEVWCSAWKTPNVVLTGGDDALLRIWDLRDTTATQTMVSKWFYSRFRNRF